MKKNIVFAFVAALVMAACTNQETIETAPAVPTAKTAQSNTRSYDEALKIAENAIGMLEDSKSTTRSGESCRKIDLSDNKVIMRDAKTRGELDGSDSLIYVFNFENNEGFALVSASKLTEPLLAITEKGHYSPDTPTAIEGFEDFINNAKDFVEKSYLRGGNDTIAIIIDEEEYVYSDKQYKGPYIPVQWGQNYPEGELYSNTTCGCGPTVMAQIMTYYKYPTSMILQYEEDYNENQSFNWNAMISHNCGHELSQCAISNYSIHQSISRLCRNLGELSGSYISGPNTTSTPTSGIKSCMEQFFTTSNWTSFSSVNITGNINSHKLMVVNGNRWNSNHQKRGHVWALDGYMKVMCTSYLYGHYEGHLERILLDSYGPYPVYYYHYNWGWYGQCNGYFLDGVYNTKNAEEYDSGAAPSASDEERNYNMDLQILTVYR